MYLSNSMISSTEGHRCVAIIGSGPRGLAVLERIAARLLEEPPKDALTIFLFDSGHIGTGRIWRKGQPDWFVMNTVADEVSAFSGPLDEGTIRPGAGPSLAEWWKKTDPSYPGENSYAPRALYGRYMEYVLTTIERFLPANAVLVKINSEVVELLIDNGRCDIKLKGGEIVVADRVVLTTGHSTNNPTSPEQDLISFSIENNLKYIKSDSAADMPLEELNSSNKIYIVGQGLSFFDVISSLTEGRGGKFIESDNGTLSYLKSGSEPEIFSGSRSGMVIPGRGKNQKHANYRYSSVIFTSTKVHSLKLRKPISFLEDVFPLISAEINFIFYKTLIKNNCGLEASKVFENRVSQQSSEKISIEDLRQLAKEYLTDMPDPVDLDEISRPFHNQLFESPFDFEKKLISVLERDIGFSMEGNIDSPIKAALDVIRDSRGLIRDLVDFGGLTPTSHKTEFIDWYVPRSAFLSAGPPLYRIRQTIALIKSGVLKIVGPAATVKKSVDLRKFHVYSPAVKGSSQHVDTIIDARVPVMDLLNDESPLTTNLLKRGYWTPFINSHIGDVYQTGGVDVTRAPFHPIDRSGVPVKELYVLGIPSEHTRWFMQAGSSRPGFWTDFFVDADAIAADLVELKIISSEHLSNRQTLEYS